MIRKFASPGPILLGLIVTLGSGTALAATRSGTDLVWPQFGYSAAHNGSNSTENSINTGNVSTVKSVWSCCSGSQQSDDIVAAGSVFFVDGDTHTLQAVTLTTGKPEWSIAWSGIDDPAYGGGLLFATNATRVNQLEALNPASGKVVWSHSIAAGLSAPTLANGHVLVTSRTTVIAFSSTGKRLWSRTVERASKKVAINDVTPAEYGGAVYVTTSSGRLYALGAGKGRSLWESRLRPQSVGRTVLEVSSGYVLVLTPVEVITVNTASHRLHWSYTQGATPANCVPGMAAANGLVYEVGLGTGPHGANSVGEAINLKTGKPMWAFATYGYCAADPSVANGVLYAEDSAGNLFAYNASTGARLAVFNHAGGWPSYPAIVGNWILDGNQAFALGS